MMTDDASLSRSGMRGNNLAALVLAAGYSSRMGQFKPLLPFGRSTVIESAVDCFSGAGIRNITVVVGHRASELQSLLERGQLRCVFNPAYNQGMYSSVVAGLHSLPSEVEACFLLPGDMPGIQPDTIRRIAKEYAETQAPILYPVLRGRRGHPPLISRPLFAAIVSGEGTGGLRALLAGYDSQARDLPVQDEGIHLDLDTPEDYARLSAERPL
jgi:CTP:molybdopterin cytidylyltransferase MocA